MMIFNIRISEKARNCGALSFAMKLGQFYSWVSILLACICFAPAAVAKDGSLFGRYLGVLKHEALKKEQLAKLDFVVSRSSSNELELKAILSLHFGDFKSGEYVSYHYDRVRYNVLTGALVFDSPDQPLSIFVKGFAAGKLVGEVNSIWAGRIGQLILNQEPKEVKPTNPLIEPVWGEYLGNCGDETARLQLYTMRSTEDLAHLAQPFSPYFIKGIMPMACRDGSCLNFLFTSGSYNFFAKEGQLTISGPRLSLRCDVDGNDLHCKSPIEPGSGGYDLSNCSFKRVSKETMEPRQFSPIKQTGSFSSSSSETPLSSEGLKALQSGEYQGYVFHENLGVYQAASLNVNLFQTGSGTEGGARISAFSRLFFGDSKSSEFIPYRFQEKAYPNPLLGAQNLVFERVDANMDAVIQITEVTDGVLRGNWYSNIFGRVGPFELRKDRLPTLPDGAKKMERLSGTYIGTKTLTPSSLAGQWSIQLQVAPGTKPPTTTENPFFPNFLTGTMYLENITPRMAITNGSYDFYTGRFGFVKGEGSSSENSWIGSQNGRSELQLHHVAAPSIGPLFKFRPQNFRLVQEFP